LLSKTEELKYSKKAINRGASQNAYKALQKNQDIIAARKASTSIYMTSVATVTFTEYNQSWLARVTPLQGAP